MASINSPSDKAAEERVADPAPGITPQAVRQDLPVVERKLGIALVGLGTYSEQQLGPALTETSYCRLAAVVSGDREKCERWRLQYDLKDKNLYSYETFDEIGSNTDIDIVYITLPNAKHAEFVTRAAKAGKHVMCEKPLATNAEDCQRMIRACKEAGVKLSVGYRLHFEPLNQEMMRLGQNQILGSIKRVIARHAIDVGKEGQWRLKKNLAGGGALMDVGIYCIQGALYTIGELPIAVTARFLPKTDPEKFSEVEEGIEWEMDFPAGVKAICEAGYNKKISLLRVETISGWFELEPAYDYAGLRGNTSEGPMTLSTINQQAAQMDDFALCVQNDTPTRVPGEMGLRDVHILQAIYQAARTGQKVELQLHEFENLIEI